MKSVLSEYGLLIFAIICAFASVRVIIHMFGDPNEGIAITYEKLQVYNKGSLLSSGVDSEEYFANTGIVTKVEAPQFVIKDSSDVRTTYFLGRDASGHAVLNKYNNGVEDVAEVYAERYTILVPSDTVDNAKARTSDHFVKTYTRTELYNLFTFGGMLRVERDMWDGRYDAPLDKVKIVITEMKPTVIDVDDKYNLTFMTSERFSYDSYGQELYEEATGNRASSEQLIYDEIVYSDGDDADFSLDEFKIDFSIPCKYQVIYRYTDDNGLKCEYICLWVNDVITEHQRLEGLGEL